MSRNSSLYGTQTMSGHWQSNKEAGQRPHTWRERPLLMPGRCLDSVWVEWHRPCTWLLLYHPIEHLGTKSAGGRLWMLPLLGRVYRKPVGTKSRPWIRRRLARAHFRTNIFFINLRTRAKGFWWELKESINSEAGPYFLWVSSKIWMNCPQLKFVPRWDAGPSAAPSAAPWYAMFCPWELFVQRNVS